MSSSIEERRLDGKLAELDLLRDAIKLPILFYTIDWTPEKRAEWLRITGSAEATTKVMCDHLRSVLAIAGAKEQP